MPFRDSVDKVVTAYFAAVTAVPFTYKGREYPVPTLVVSPLLLRGFTCPAGCGGCCPTFSLDYLPSEKRPDNVQERFVLFNGRAVRILSDTQEGRTEHHCGNLNMSTGRCGVHGKHPFSCDFELIRFLHSHSPSASARMLTKLFGRGHAMLRVDGERGALCGITEPTPESRDDAIRKLERLLQWANHFHLPTRIPYILAWARDPVASSNPLTLPAPSPSSLF